MNGDELLVYLSVWEDKEFIGRSVGFEEWILTFKQAILFSKRFSPEGKEGHTYTYLSVSLPHR